LFFNNYYSIVPEGGKIVSVPWRVGVIGPGRLGTALAVELVFHGCNVPVIAGRNMERAKYLADRINSDTVLPSDVVFYSDLIILTVSDDAIEPLAVELSQKGDWRGKIALHTSGSYNADVLSALGERGAQIGGIHPLRSFTGDEHIPEGVYFGIEGEPQACDVASRLVNLLGGVPFKLTSGTKELYHTAACFAANFTVVLKDVADQLMAEAGMTLEQSNMVLVPLIEGVVSNLKTIGTAKALTGPIARGDFGTVKRHCKALEHARPDLLPLYITLARHTLNLALRNGLSKTHIQSMEDVLAKFDGINGGVDR
jgi:predicted short-subunit dehydrogenase-like oxidoreductase (DUF2520 family)